MIKCLLLGEENNILLDVCILSKLLILEVFIFFICNLSLVKCCLSLVLFNCVGVVFVCMLNVIFSKGNVSYVSWCSMFMKIILFLSFWMVFVVELFKLFSGDMSINLCG